MRGVNYHPQDLEWAAAQAEGVRNGRVAAFSVVGAGQERLVVVAEGTKGSVQKAQRSVGERLQRVFGVVPDEVCIVPVGTLPYTSSGKLQRTLVRRWFERGELEVLS